MSGINFINFCKNLTLEDWDKKVNNKWMVKEIISHLVGWEKEVAQSIKTVWETKKDPWFMVTDNYDDFNNNAVEFYKNYSKDDLLNEWEKWQKETDKQIAEIGEANLRKRYSLFEWAFDEGENGHNITHYRQIKEILKK